MALSSNRASGLPPRQRLGILFHPEADLALLEAWLAVPKMVREARQALGDEGAHALSGGAEAAEQDLIERTTPGLKALAALVEANRPTD